MKVMVYFVDVATYILQVVAIALGGDAFAGGGPQGKVMGLGFLLLISLVQVLYKAWGA